jgi:hypothetical protein
MLQNNNTNTFNEYDPPKTLAITDIILEILSIISLLYSILTPSQKVWQNLSTSSYSINNNGLLNMPFIQATLRGWLMLILPSILSINFIK